MHVAVKNLKLSSSSQISKELKSLVGPRLFIYTLLNAGTSVFISQSEPCS